MKFIKKHKDDRIKKLKTKIYDLEEENNELRRQIFHYRLKKGDAPPKPRRMMKVMGNRGRGTLSGGAE